MNRQASAGGLNTPGTSPRISPQVRAPQQRERAAVAALSALRGDEVSAQYRDVVDHRQQLYADHAFLSSYAVDARREAEALSMCACEVAREVREQDMWTSDHASALHLARSELEAARIASTTCLVEQHQVEKWCFGRAAICRRELESLRNNFTKLTASRLHVVEKVTSLRRALDVENFELHTETLVAELQRDKTHEAELQWAALEETIPSQEEIATNEIAEKNQMIFDLEAGSAKSLLEQQGFNRRQLANRYAQGGLGAEPRGILWERFAAERK